MRAHRIKVMVMEDHRLSVTLPEDFPEGPAEVIVLADIAPAKRVVQLAGVLAPGKAPPGDEDPVADALRELRQERSRRFQQNADSEGNR